MSNVEWRKFQEAFQYADTIRAGNVRNLTIEKGEFRATLLKVDFDRLWMQAGFESLPRSAHVAVGNRPGILFPAGPTHPTFHVGTSEVEHGAVAFLSAGSSFFQRTGASSRWASLSLSPDDLTNASLALTGRPLDPPDNFRIVRPEPVAMVRLTALHAHARQLAKDTPDLLLQQPVRRSMEEALTQALVACLAGDAAAERPLSQHQHASVMERFNSFIELNADQPVYLTQVCKSIAVSERTLRRCCLEQLGMGPNRYLLLRRLHLARRKLVEAHAESSTVTDVATEFGFWALGRFAGMYRAVFGEPPSATLSHPSEHSKPLREPFVLAGLVLPSARKRVST